MRRVTVGVPVYNGASSIEHCLENLASQDFTGFEVLISDNGSSDGTSEICAAFSAKDERFTHVRHDSTSDAMTNFFWVRDQARSPLFAWRAHDDWSSPDYLSRLVDCFDRHPRCELAVGSVVTRSYRASGEPRVLRFPYPGSDRSDGFIDIFRKLYRARASWIYGLWDREALQRVTSRLWPAYSDPWGFDHLCVASAILDGKLCGDPEAEFTQHMDRRPRDHGVANQTPQQMLALRQRFGGVLADEIASRGWNSMQRLAFRLLVPVYMDHRLDHRRRIYKMMLRERLADRR